MADFAAAAPPGEWNGFGDGGAWPDQAWDDAWHQDQPWLAPAGKGVGAQFIQDFGHPGVQPAWPHGPPPAEAAPEPPPAWTPPAPAATPGPFPPPWMNPGMPFIYPPMGWSAPPPPPPANPAAETPNPLITALETKLAALTASMGHMAQIFRAATPGSPETRAAGSPLDTPEKGANPHRGPLFSETILNTKPLEPDLKKLFMKHEVHPTIETLCISKNVRSTQTFYNVGHNQEHAREALTQLAELDLRGAPVAGSGIVGVVEIANLLACWQDLRDIHTDKASEGDDALASMQVQQAIDILNDKFGLELPPYRMGTAIAMNLVMKNYKRLIYDVVDLRKMRCMSLNPFDPLSYKNKKEDHQLAHYWGRDGQVHTKEEYQELDFKSFRRAVDIYLFIELAVGNMANPKQAGELPHMTHTDKIVWETFLMQFGFDPPVRVRMEFEHLVFAEYHCRAALMLLFKHGHTWATAVAKLQSKLEAKFMLRMETTTEPEEVRKMKQMQNELNRQKEELARVKKTAANRSKGSWDRWSPYESTNKGDKGGKKGGGKGDGYFLEKCPTTGTAYCRRKNLNQPHDESNCQYLHQCNWSKCPDRTTCEGAFKHKKFDYCPPTGKKGKHKGGKW